MANLRVQRRRGKGSDDGASLVEFALIAPLLFMLLLGTITGGLTLSRQNSVTNAVREATRFGAVYPTSDMDAYLLKVLEQVEVAASGDLNDGVDRKTICVAYISETDTVTALEQVPGQNAPTSRATACFDDKRNGFNEARVQVSASRRSDIEGILFTLRPTLSSDAVTRYERAT